MQRTLELLERALSKGQSARELSKTMGLTATTLAVAKHRGSLSPVVAGQLAEFVGEDIEHWMALAAIEAAPRSRVTDHLKRAITTARSSSKV